MTLTEKLPVWLDCDTGNDDTFAILLAALHEQYNLVGISTVFGNAPLHNTTHNTLAILDILGFKQNEIKVYSGASKPLKIAPRYATNIHGETGIEGAILPKFPKVEESKDQTYLEALRHAVLQYKGELNVVCTGSLTNMSHFITTYPELRSKINFVAVMGGGINIGNITPYAEFNMHCDPHAAKNVITDSILKDRTVLVPLNITHKAIATEQIHAQMYSETDPSINSNARKVYYDIISFFGQAYKMTHKGFQDGPPVHDPLTVFVLLGLLNNLTDDGDDFDIEYLRGDVQVIEEGEHEGETVLTEDTSKASGTYVAMDINFQKFWSFVLESLANSDKKTHAIQ